MKSDRTNVELKSDGLERLSKNLNDLGDGAHDVPLTELFPDSFLAQNTNFNSLTEMVEAGGLDSPDDFNGQNWSVFVAAQSRFADWNEMLAVASREWISRKLTR